MPTKKTPSIKPGHRRWLWIGFIAIAFTSGFANPAPEMRLILSPGATRPDTLVQELPDGRLVQRITTADLEDAFGYKFTELSQLHVDPIRGTVTFLGLIDFVPIGIYHLGGPEFQQLDQWVEPDSPIVGFPNQPLRGFAIHGFRRGVLTFSAIRNLTNTSGIYQFSQGEITSLVAVESELPDGFGDGSRVVFKGQYGNRLWFEKTLPSVPPQSGLFVRKGPDEFTLLARTGTPIPRTATHYHSCQSVLGTRDHLVIEARTTDLETQTLVWNKDRVEPLAQPGDTTAGGEQIESYLGSVQILGDRVFFRATTPTGAIRWWSRKAGVLAILPEGTTPPPEAPLPSLQITREGQQLLLTVPDQFELEFRPHWGATAWSSLGIETPVVHPPMGSSGFFRLRQYGPTRATQ